MTDASTVNSRLTVALIHGAFADSSSWNDVAGQLQAAIGLSTTTARASALVPDPYRVRAACPQRVRWSQCGQPTDRH